MSSCLTCTKLTLFTVAAVLLQIIGLSLFVLGYFPVKPALSGVSGPESFRSPTSSSDSIGDHNVSTVSPNELKTLYQELSEVPPSFDRLILMVIDGLPAEFVLGRDGEPLPRAYKEAMPYTHSMLAKGMAIGFHAKAAPPTVTMPRLKAMMSGAIGGFLDVAFNFNTQALLDDSLIGQLYNIGWKMVMLGDETWLKLFPGLFSRQDGVSSFFVKDTVEVDHNVSRHLSDELDQTDWSLLILHYLGLDHVGHLGGRQSVLMGPKLWEMDEVIKKIHLSTVQTRNKDQGRTLLMVVSDHGMTESGNHGGSTYEETDSLALLVGFKNNEYASTSHKTVCQVDIAPTLALLFGVPIPKNNVGVLMVETFNSLTDYQRLRALELNSWQLLRLLQAQLPDFSCGPFSSEFIRDHNSSGIRRCDGSQEKMFCCLFSDAAALHQSWKAKRVAGFSHRDDYKSTELAYFDFLRAVSEWLSQRITDKPIGFVTSGVAAILFSCLLLLCLIFKLVRETHIREKFLCADVNNYMHKWHLDETFILIIIMVLVLSMGSSSFVEEEQYVWNFVTCTYFMILLRKALKFIMVGTAQSSSSVSKGQTVRGYVQISSIIAVLLSARILRGWHQGGVNWTYLPDISKLLEKAGSTHIKSVYILSWVIVMSLSLYSLSLLWSVKSIVMVVGFIILIPGCLVLQSVIKFQDSIFAAGSTVRAQIIYAILGTLTVGTAIAIPWLMPAQNPRSWPRKDYFSTDAASEFRSKFSLQEIKDALYIIGWVYIFCWCLLQLLLQQPINSLPISLLLVQIFACMCYSSHNGQPFRQWNEVAALYCLGMTGHFSLGNTNTLATIDVAGAFIGISSHSTFLSGILMFMITYASPMLAILSMVTYISVKGGCSLGNHLELDFGEVLKTYMGFPCLLPLAFNSVILVAYTIVLLLMRNHLFVWSVFSPKYLYVCAATVCVYLGVLIVASTVIYVFAVQRMLQSSRRIKLE